jgi:hypothetical protein
MTVQTNLSVSPYFDDYTEEKDFYKILFKPGVSVQVRELNQLQTILQNQIQRFGDNVFKQGTIIDGCDIVFHPDLQYVKIKDVTTASNNVIVTQYNGYRVRNQNDITPLEATIITTEAGFESTNPNLNSLYLRYINSGFKTGGSANGQLAFEQDEILTVYDPNQVIERIDVTEDGRSQGFSPNDRVVILSAIEIQNTSSGTEFTSPFTVGEFITDGTANVQITAISNTAIPGSIVLSVKPTVQSLKDNDQRKWTLFRNTNIQKVSDPSVIAQIKSIVGAGATARLTTSSIGRIASINMTSKGSGYIVPPTVSISSLNNQLNNIEQVNALAQTFIANVTVANVSNPVGTAYAITIGEGIVYQKGYFSRVAEQLLLVSKYSNTPDQVAVGFETIEDIVNSNQDTSLLDNATGAPNVTAPGADRLKLTPRLITLSKTEADLREDFLYIVEFANGLPYKQNRQTVYNIIGNEIARRTAEESGDYVIDQFQLQTRSPRTFSEEANNFSIIIDPGKAYINGNRVETVTNFETNVQKGNDIVQSVNANISLNFGNYVRVNQFGGFFNFKTGDIVNLYSAAGQYLTSAAVGTAPASSGLGTLIGTARIRSVVFDSGVPGSPEAVFRLYLFDIKMNSGANFANVKSIFYNGSDKGVADPIQENDQTVLYDTTTSSLLYYAGAPAVQSVSDVSYIYRTSNTYQIGTNGEMTISLPSGGTEEFPYTGQLSSIQERDVIVVPLANTEASTNLSGTITVVSGSNTATISGSTATSAELKPGDFIKVGTAGFVQVATIANNTNITLRSNAAFSASANTYKYAFPANVPISFEYRTDRTFTVDVTKKQMTVNIGINLAAAQNLSVSYNVRQASVTPIAKTVNRNQHIRLCLGNNAAYSAGPWCMGVSDVFRLNNVYRGANSTFSGSDTGITDITQYFYIDHNQSEDFTNISYLYLKPNAQVALANTTSEFLLVSFDRFTVDPGAEGLKSPGGSGTYNVNDSVELQNAVSTINTIEIPEVFGVRGDYYDLRDQFDLRPNANSTVTPSATPSTAPINPAEQAYASLISNNDKRFPAPDSELSATINYYVGRKDRVVIDGSNNFRIIKGTPGKEDAPVEPDNALTIQILNVPAYPSIPFVLSEKTLKYVDTKIANEKYSTNRLNKYRVTTSINAINRDVLQPRRYTMQDIGSLERRIETLEYYTSLNLAETLAKKRVIPGFDGLDRFKFGFYVDGFEDYTFADLENPGYSASIVDGYLSPRVNEVNLIATPSLGNDPTLTYNETTLVSQSRATSDTSGESVIGNQTIVCVNQAERTGNNSDSGNVFEEFYYAMSSMTGPVEFYINSRDNWIGAEIFQSNSPNGPWTATTSSVTAQAITQEDVIAKQLSLNGNRKIEHLGTLERAFAPTGTSWGTFLEDQFKMLWEHDPDNGIYYKIRIYKGGKHGGLIAQGKRGTFEYKLCYPVDSTVNTVVNIPTTAFPITYYGTVIAGGGGRPSLHYLFEQTVHVH